ncbi:MAG: MFS transporter [Conexivisphaerales archaeon]
MDKYLTTGIIGMMFASVFQYSWNAFELTLPIISGASQFTLSLVFTMFVIVSSVSQIFTGILADYFGPQRVYLFAALISGTGMALASQSGNITEFALFWLLGSIGEGAIYGISVNLALKWNEKNRGFASGFVGMGFGIGAMLANPFIFLFKSFRFPMLIVGIAMLFVLLLLSRYVKYPISSTGRSPSKVIREGRWWLIFASYSFAASPLQLFSYFLLFLSLRFGISYFILVSIIFPFVNGIGRPFIGRISDSIGRITSIIFILACILAGSVLAYVGTEVSVLIATMLIAFFGGSLFTLYSSYVSDLYGSRFSTANNGILYSGKAVAGLTGVFIFAIINSMYGLSGAMYFIIALGIISIVTFLVASLSSRRLQKRFYYKLRLNKKEVHYNN